MTFIYPKTRLHHSAGAHKCHCTVDERGVDDVNLEERGIGRVEAVEVHTLDEDYCAYELRAGGVWIAF